MALHYDLIELQRQMMRDSLFHQDSDTPVLTEPEESAFSFLRSGNDRTVLVSMQFIVWKNKTCRKTSTVTPTLESPNLKTTTETLTESPVRNISVKERLPCTRSRNSGRREWIEAETQRAAVDNTAGICQFP
ncbi:uncharacterized protein LOC134219414 [Armigeres subalbatus]|uniref:uncharacterized protein LOC134219414 n=1 Tax=Armigeres subalbatus TaxID=124917 RepID=UPI002ED4C911